MARFDLTDAEWAIIAPLLPSAEDRPRGGRPTENDRRVLNGIFFVLRTGTPWRDLPERYGPIVRFSERTSTRQAVKRARRARHRPFSWRTEHQDQRRRRRAWPAGPADPDRGASLGQGRRPGTDRWLTRSRSPHR